MKVSPELFKQLNELLNVYTLEVKNAGLKTSTEKHTFFTPIILSAGVTMILFLGPG